jgi:hypothetical protein
MTSVSNNNVLSQLSALASSQSVASAAQSVSTEGTSSSSSQSPASSSSKIAANIGAGYAGATQAIVGYLLNQQGASGASQALTPTDVVASVSSAHNSSSPDAASDTDKSAKTPGGSHGAGGSGGGSSASSSATTTVTETMADGSVVQITTDASGKVVSEAVIKGATPQSSSQQGSSTT